MKSKPTAPSAAKGKTKSAAAAAAASRKAGRTSKAKDKNKMKPKGQRGTTPATPAAGTGLAPLAVASQTIILPTAAPSTAPSPVTGVIRLDLSNITPAGLVTYLNDLIKGLTDNPYYTTLPADILTNLSAALASLNSIADTIVYLEGQLRAARAAQVNEMAIAKDAIRNAAFGCEQADRSDEALLSGNWKLRRTPGPSQPMGIPARLSMKNNPMPGKITARWGRVNNSRVYQVQYTDPTVIPAPDWNTLPFETALSAKFTIENYPVGSFLALRVRAVGTSGVGPWTDILTARVM